MKVLFALALLVGIALGNSTSFQGWKPERDLTYRYETESINGIPEIKGQYAGYKFVAEVQVQTFRDYTIRVQLKNPRFTVVNEVLQVVGGRPRVPKPTKALPEDWEQALTRPFEVRLRRGVVESLVVERNTPVGALNMIKGLVSQLQLDLTASRQNDVVANQILKGQQQQESESDERSFFTTEETSILGDCQTDYTFFKLPKYQAMELESDWRQEEEQLEKLGLRTRTPEHLKKQGEKACEGKDYFAVTKTKNFDNCRARPHFQAVVGVDLRCDASKAGCKDLLTHMSTSRYILCGSAEEYYIRSVSTDDMIAAVPISWNTEENLSSKTRVALFLEEVKEKSSELPKPRDPKEVKNIIYEFPQKSYKNSQTYEGQINQVEQEQGQGQQQQRSEFVPFLPKPDMESESKWSVRVISASETKEKTVQEMKRIVHQMTESPEKCTLKTDVAGYISLIADYLRPLSLTEMKEIQEAVKESFNNGQQKQQEFAKELFQDILAMVGSNPAIALIKHNIQSRQINGYRASLVLSNALRNVKTPTPQLLKEILELIQEQSRDNKYIATSGFVQLATLVHNACIDPTLKTTMYPVRAFGEFCNHNSAFISQELIPAIRSKIQSAGKDTERMILLTALGKIGHKAILPILAEAIEGKFSQKPMVRSIAIYNLARVAKHEPTLVRPILLALIENIAEEPDCRIAAVYVLPYTQPSAADLQRLGLRSWFEPSKQVASYIWTTLQSLKNTKVPSLISVGRDARFASNFVKPGFYGVQYSHNYQSDNFFQQVLTAASTEMSSVMSERSMLPTKTGIQTYLRHGSWDLDVFGLHTYSQGLDQVLDKLVKYLGLESEVSGLAKEEIEKINERLSIKPRQNKAAEALIHFDFMGIHKFAALDSETISELTQSLAEKLRQSEERIEKHLNIVHAMKTIGLTAFGPSESGMPMIAKKTIPLVVSLRGNTQVSRQSAYGLEVQAELTPLVSAKIESWIGIYVPFTGQMVGAGVDLGLHSSFGAKLQMDYKRGQVQLALKAPEKFNSVEEVELLHVVIKPFTSVTDVKSFQPVPVSSGSKVILSSDEHRQPKTFKLPKSLGLDAQVTMKADYVLDLMSVWNYVKEQKLTSSWAPMPISIRQSEIKFTWNPRNSATKEIKTRFTLVSGKKEQQQEQQLEQNFEQSAESQTAWMTERAAENQIEEIKAICAEERQTQYEIEVCQQEQKQKLEQHKQGLKQKLAQVSQEARELCQQEQDLAEQQQEQQQRQQGQNGGGRFHQYRQQLIQSEAQKALQALCHASIRVCEQAEELCSESKQQQQQHQGRSGQYGQELEQQCQEKKNACLSRQHAIRKLNKVLAQKIAYGPNSGSSAPSGSYSTGGAKAAAIKVEAAIRSGYGSEQTAHATVVVASEERKHEQENKKTIKTVFDVEFQTPNGPAYDFEMSSTNEVPELEHRWDIEGLIQEPVEVYSKAVFSYGSRRTGEKQQIVAQVQMKKSEQQKESVRQSPEYKQCQKVQSEQGRTLAPVCMEVRNQATALDNIKIKMELPEEIKRSYAFTTAESILSNLVWFNVNWESGKVEQEQQSGSQQQQQQQQQQQNGNQQYGNGAELELEFDIARSGVEAQVKYQSPVTGLRLKAKNMRMPWILRKAFPFSIRNSLSRRSLELISEKQLPATCEIENKFISTFDNKTYAYEMNGCKHLLFKDCSAGQKNSYIAVLAEGEQDSVKAVEVILGSSVVKMNSEQIRRSGASAELTIDNQKVEIAQGRPVIKRSTKTGRYILIAEMNKDNVVTVANPEERIAVHYDGKRVEIVAPARAFSKSCGLCGDMNGENTADVASPRDCILSKPRFSAYTYMLEKEGGKCRGIPQQDREQVQREERECVQKRTIHTPIADLLRNVYEKTQTQTRRHVVIEQLNKVCVSQKMIKVCPSNPKANNAFQQGQQQPALQGRQIELPFTCLKKNSASTENILKRVEGGEQVNELRGMPTFFTSSHYVPVLCGAEQVQMEKQLNRPFVYNLSGKQHQQQY